MRVGVVSYWFNRGQGTVGRLLRSALDQLGHETHVLARPPRATFHRTPGLDSASLGDEWNQPGVTSGSRYDLSAGEYRAWAESTGVEAAFFDQNYQFAEIAALRRSGVRTVGRFVWEVFAPHHVAGALEAFDAVYAVTACEHSRYRALGIDAVRVPWGCHPELLWDDPPPPRDEVEFLFPGGYLTRRKPVVGVLDAFARVEDPRARLIVHAQAVQPRERVEAAPPWRDRVLDAARTLRHGRLADPSLSAKMRRILQACEEDPRVVLILGDLPRPDHQHLLRSADVLVAPSRWEGLGLPLYEAVAALRPVVTTDAPPMNEVVVHGLNGLLATSRPAGETPSGVPAVETEVASLAEQLRALCDDTRRRELRQGSEQRRAELSWDHTVAAVGTLLDDLLPPSR